MLLNTIVALAGLTTFGSARSVAPRCGPSAEVPQRVVGGYIASWGTSETSSFLFLETPG